MDNSEEHKTPKMFEKSQKDGFFIDTILLAENVDGMLYIYKHTEVKYHV